MSKLLMIRRAGASFGGNFNIGLPWLKPILDEYISLGAELERLQQHLVSEIHALVPQSNDRHIRNFLLKLKRDIFNGRTISLPDVEMLQPPLCASLTRYSDLLRCRKSILDSNRQKAMEELRQQLDGLINHEKFRAAVDYSCPWLADAYTRHAAQNAGFSDQDRGVYSYAVKFFSKANPFYSFATVALPSSAVNGAGSFCEIVVDSAVIFALEKMLLPRVRDPYLRLVSLCSFERDGGSFRFWVGRDGAVQLIKVKATTLLECVVGYFRLNQREYSLGGLMDCVSGAVSQDDIEMARQSVYAAVERGIIREYLVADIDNFPRYLSGLSSEHDQVVQTLGELHLACRSTEDLPRIHKTILDLNLPTLTAEGDLPKNLYYVNSYDQDDFSPHEALPESLFEDLKGVKPFFYVSNFSDQSHVIAAFVRNHIAGCPNQKIQYLDLVRVFLRDLNTIVAASNPSDHNGNSRKQAYKRWRAELISAHGRLSQEKLASLSAAMPRRERVPGPICFNGAFDYRERILYLSNIFAGGGRYSSRFLLSRNSKRYQPAPETSSVLDVQLVVPLKNNRDYIAAMFPVACGFDSRYSYKFEQWIDPAQVTVELQGDEIIYRDCSSCKLVRFHFCGFLLAEYLPPEYKLLLLHHADCYINPFESLTVPEPGHADFVPGLQYGSVCLRRPKWVVDQSLLQRLLHEDDMLTCAAMLREFLHYNLCASVDQWYFKTLAPGAKPRYLDPNNPLSVNVFCRDVAQAGINSPVIFSRMEPGPNALLPRNDGRFMTELMVEV